MESQIFIYCESRDDKQAMNHILEVHNRTLSNWHMLLEHDACPGVRRAVPRWLALICSWHAGNFGGMEFDKLVPSFQEIHDSWLNSLVKWYEAGDGSAEYKAERYAEDAWLRVAEMGYDDELPF